MIALSPHQLKSRWRNAALCVLYIFLTSLPSTNLATTLSTSSQYTTSFISVSVRRLQKQPPKDLVIPCERWARLVWAMKDLGPNRLSLYMSANPQMFDKTDMMFLGDVFDFAQSITVKKDGAYAMAMLHCDAWDSA